MSQIQTHFHPGSGLKPLLIGKEWQTARLNHAPELAGPALRKVERHAQTDEVFVGIHGGHVLITLGAGAAGPWELVRTYSGITYNVPAGVGTPSPCRPEIRS